MATQRERKTACTRNERTSVGADTEPREGTTSGRRTTTAATTTTIATIATITIITATGIAGRRLRIARALCRRRRRGRGSSGRWRWLRGAGSNTAADAVRCIARCICGRRCRRFARCCVRARIRRLRVATGGGACQLHSPRQHEASDRRRPRRHTAHAPRQRHGSIPHARYTCDFGLWGKSKINHQPLIRTQSAVRRRLPSHAGPRAACPSAMRTHSLTVWPCGLCHFIHRRHFGEARAWAFSSRSPRVARPVCMAQAVRRRWCSMSTVPTSSSAQWA